ncbi:30S ribosome-binding factor RbfA [Ornithobacterium rhinotracheale]|uniref:30S ribosome-binding factor RbfA n=1 Tax=Ornithobacterium rhinotracheale TaxID=28251 RepID=UPI00129D0986|nr:30S ribosome-binding factor RbfA [Ornithobacterium rhinotracheale]MRI63160.1 30S ribosome-binding factor RbfA [Ornithobacterium rhinotracheale]
MESNRLHKVNQLLQQELAEIFRVEGNKMKQGLLVSVTEVRTTSDLSIAKTYISVFPTQYRAEVLKTIVDNKSYFRKLLGERVGKQMRIVPDLQFYSDESLDQVDAIERELKGKGNNPIL